MEENKQPMINAISKDRFGSYEYFLNIFPSNDKGITLLSSLQKRNGDYGKFDLYLFLQYADTCGIDFLTLLRILFYELSQIMSPDMLMGKLKQRGYSLYAETGTFDKTEPIGFLDLLKSKSEKNEAPEIENSNYFNALKYILESSELEDKKMAEKHRADIASFLSKESLLSDRYWESLKGNSAVKKLEDEPSSSVVLGKGIKDIISEKSPLGSVLLGIEIEINEAQKKDAKTLSPTSTTDEKEIYLKEEGILDLSYVANNILVPLEEIKWKGLEQKELDKIKKVFSATIEGKITIRVGQR